MHMGFRRGIDTRHLVIAEVGLLGLALFEGQAAIKRIAKTHDRSAFELRRDAVGMYHHAAIDGEVNAPHGHRSIRRPRDVRDRRDIAQETAMDGYPASLT